jgi:phage protein U
VLADGREIKLIDFFDGERTVLDVGKDMEQITLSGVEIYNTAAVGEYLLSSPTEKMARLDTIVENRETVTLSGFNNPTFDTTWIIESYSYTVRGGMPNVVEYSITLEKV